MTGLAPAFIKGRPALITYLMAGYPDREGSLAALRAAAAAGADLIELGVPYADPLADGPAIVEAANVAKAAVGGFGLAETLELARELTAADGFPPIAVMSYLNPMLRHGLGKLATDAVTAGVAGFIVPDLPPDNPMAAQWTAACRSSGVDTVFLVAPTSTPERIRKAGARSTGFLYLVSSLGVTGERASLAAGLGEMVASVRRDAGDLPIAIGFGVSTPEQASEVAALADGVIVGSAIVRRQRDPDAVGAFVAELAAAVRRA